VCLCKGKRFRFWRIAEIQNQGAQKIAQCLSEVVRELNAKGFVVTSVVTDNASNERSALNEEHAYSIQRLTGVFVFRTPCLSHTANLALEECFHPCFQLRDTRSDMQTIRDARRHPVVWDDFYGLTSIARTRRLSVGQFIDGLSNKPALGIVRLSSFT
jgi:hypothetical protein